MMSAVPSRDDVTVFVESGMPIHVWKLREMREWYANPRLETERDERVAMPRKHERPLACGKGTGTS